MALERVARRATTNQVSGAEGFHEKFIDYVGPLPADVQQTTVFSSGIIVDAREAEPARALVKFLTTPEAGAVFRKRGMEPG